MSLGGGRNIPGFRETQLAFSAYIRDPDNNPKPSGIEDRRLKIYRDLFYNNIESLLASAFPVSKAVLGPQRWEQLMRSYLAEHGAQSPYFLEVSQELLEYLAESDHGPEFLLELAHYEWIELALDVAETSNTQVDPHGDLMSDKPVLTEAMAALTYRWPVNEIGPNHQPAEPPAEPTLLIVYRNESDQVKFLKSSPGMHRLLALLPDASSGDSLAQSLSAELTTMPAAAVTEHVVQTLQQLRDDSIIIGTAIT
ncbi:MAG: putative DNA-binding domain-containing protein, partial [Pseudomonadaceae bacterium]|nr:putative DNA-binding domain-containing protein [Pseudomonadaceae bacterium]